MSLLKMPETEIEYRNALIDAAELGAKKALEEAGLMKPYLKLSEANRLYGRRKVAGWIHESLLTLIKDGENNSAVRIRRTEIEALAKVSNRHHFYIKKASDNKKNATK